MLVPRKLRRFAAFDANPLIGSRNPRTVVLLTPAIERLANEFNQLLICKMPPPGDGGRVVDSAARLNGRSAFCRSALGVRCDDRVQIGRRFQRYLSPCHNAARDGEAALLRAAAAGRYSQPSRSVDIQLLLSLNWRVTSAFRSFEWKLRGSFGARANCVNEGRWRHEQGDWHWTHACLVAVD
jgi:hypothetical protein